MNGYYEHERDNLTGLNILESKNFIYPAHFHHKIELFVLKSGELTVTVNGVEYNLSSGSIALFNSYDVHSYNYQSPNLKGFCLIIPPDSALRFFERNKNKTAKNPVIFNEYLTSEVYFLIEKYVKNQNNKQIEITSVEFILSLIESSLEFIKIDTDKDSHLLVKKILTYVNENFKGDVSLKTVAKNLGYTEAHVSRVFNKYVKKSLSEYVNELRIGEVEKILTTKNKPVTQAVFDAGFKSLQTYYRTKNKSC